MQGTEIEKAIELMAKLPGLGPRSARKALLYLLKNRQTRLEPLARALNQVNQMMSACQICGNLDTQTPCAICCNPRRDPGLLCVVEEVDDLWALEKAQVFKGTYHVLGGLLSALHEVGPDELGIPKLLARIHEGCVKEVIIATSATLAGQTTMHYIAEILRPKGVILSAPAQGVPLGGELDHMDSGTLNAALSARRIL